LRYNESGATAAMLAWLNVFFFVFHSFMIVFILFGWAWKKLRPANLAVILLTAFSWFILGIWYGYGYCPSTDWHWRVRSALGIRDLPESYTKFLVDSFTGGDVSQRMVDVFTLVLLLSALAVSLTLNIRDRRKKRRGRSSL
jgi:hypothetical protein